jgi:hypothetical protein
LRQHRRFEDPLGADQRDAFACKVEPSMQEGVRESVAEHLRSLGEKAESGGPNLRVDLIGREI